jgi:hypothetical protein
LGTMTTEQRAALYLTSLRYWIQCLREFANAWDTGDLDVRERQAFPLEWDNAIDRLVDVEAMARDGDLRAGSLVELRRVAGELVELLPTMRRLGVRQPDPEALERARSVEAA